MLNMYSQDAPSANKMLKSHQIQEQSIDDFSKTIQQLSQTSRQLVDEQHPDR